VNFWRGCKLHLPVADGGVPVAALLTSASLHDSQAAIPMMQKCAQRVKSLCDLADSADDAADIRSFSQGPGHVPVIDANWRRKADAPEMDPVSKVRYRERSTVERCNSDLKDNYGARALQPYGRKGCQSLWRECILHVGFVRLVIVGVLIVG
jgi:hypothetical protein